jgi:hypothetical protein
MGDKNGGVGRSERRRENGLAYRGCWEREISSSLRENKQEKHAQSPPPGLMSLKAFSVSYRTLSTDTGYPCCHMDQERQRSQQRVRLTIFHTINLDVS